MRGMLTPFCLTVALIMAAVMSARDAHAQDFLNQEWILDPTLSTVYMQTEKANYLFETHQFSVVEGSVSSSGDAIV